MIIWHNFFSVITQPQMGRLQRKNRDEADEKKVASSRCFFHECECCNQQGYFFFDNPLYSLPVLSNMTTRTVDIPSAESVMAEEHHSSRDSFATSTSAGKDSIDIDAILDANKNTIRDILTNSQTGNDASILQGVLLFCHSKFIVHITSSLAEQFDELRGSEQSYEEKTLTPLDHNGLADANSVGNVIDRVWMEIHHPAIKYFQSSFYQMNKSLKEINSNTNNGSHLNNKRNSNINKFKFNNNNQFFVENRKLFDRFVKFISKAYDFYFSILKTILTTYDLSIYMPVKKLCSTLKMNLDLSTENLHSLPESSSLVSTMIYLTHKCVLYIGDLSRYRTLIAKTYLPSTSISKEDNNNYSKSIELYKLSLLILPSLGDPYNHIAIIDNLKDDKFNVVYNFIRALSTSSPLTIAYSNLLNLLTKNPKTNSILKKFEHLNSLDRNSITKNDRLGLLKSQFLILFNFNLLPNKWKLKEGFLVSGSSIKDIEEDFLYLLSTLDFHKQIFNDFYFKQLVILTGGFDLLIDPKNSDDSKLDQSTDVISDYLDFMFRYLETFLKIFIKICDQNLGSSSLEENHNNTDVNSKNYSMAFSTSLFPVIRLLLCWFKEREIARVYLQRSNDVSYLLATLINKFMLYMKNQKNITSIVSELLNVDSVSLKVALSSRPVRQRLFKEDVALREFKPINYLLTDFDDLHLYKRDPQSVLALIGELPDLNDSLNEKTASNSKINDNVLRLVAIIVLGKSIIKENVPEIEWNDENQDLDEACGFFSFQKNIDLQIKAPSVRKKHNASISNNLEKPKDMTSKQSRRIKNSELKSSGTTLSPNSENVFNSSTANSYAGSSFGSLAPSATTFGKFDKVRRNNKNNTKGIDKVQAMNSFAEVSACQEALPSLAKRKTKNSNKSNAERSTSYVPPAQTTISFAQRKHANDHSSDTVNAGFKDKQVTFAKGKHNSNQSDAVNHSNLNSSTSNGQHTKQFDSVLENLNFDIIKNMDLGAGPIPIDRDQLNGAKAQNNIDTSISEMNDLYYMDHMNNLDSMDGKNEMNAMGSMHNMNISNINTMDHAYGMNNMNHMNGINHMNSLYNMNNMNSMNNMNVMSMMNSVGMSLNDMRLANHMNGMHTLLNPMNIDMSMNLNMNTMNMNNININSGMGGIPDFPVNRLGNFVDFSSIKDNNYDLSGTSSGNFNSMRENEHSSSNK